MSIVMSRTRSSGRHRLGRPGLIPVTALVTVTRRGFFWALFRTGRHHGPVPVAARRLTANRAAVPAAG